MIERVSQPTSQTLIGNLLQLNAIIIRDCVSPHHSNRDEVFESGENEKNYEKLLRVLRITLVRLLFRPVSRDCSLFSEFAIIIFSHFYYLI